MLFTLHNNSSRASITSSIRVVTSMLSSSNWHNSDDVPRSNIQPSLTYMSNSQKISYVTSICQAEWRPAWPEKRVRLNENTVSYWGSMIRSPCNKLCICIYAQKQVKQSINQNPSIKCLCARIFYIFLLPLSRRAQSL